MSGRQNMPEWGKWGIELDDIKLECGKHADKLARMWDRAKSHMDQRTEGFEFFGRVAHNMNLFDRGAKGAYSEGSTQAIKRKIRAQTIQRVPDGEITTQYDKNSIEQIVIEYLFDNKVVCSEFDGQDMLKNLWRTFNEAYDYGFGCVRTGFERDLDGDPRISYTLIPWYDIFPSPDCKFIEQADWYIVREYMPLSSFAALLDPCTHAIKDPTYNENVVKYVIEHEVTSASDYKAIALADKMHGKTPTDSLEVRTYYKRGKDKFITYIPSLGCVLREVDNFDPRLDVPLHFLILEPDPEYPLGCSMVQWTLSQQQFADAFQSTAYQTLLLALHPPLQVFGNITNPKIKMKPNAIWPMGTNQNNRIEPYRVETTALTQYGSILENVSGKMMQSLNITDATVASDANVANYSGTPQGVEQQRNDKTITINQFQKRIETFFGEWANHALRSYIASMSGQQELTVDERTRRRVFDVERHKAQAANTPDELPESIIDGNKISIDFDELSSDLLEFEVRTGSLIESEREKELENIQRMIVPVSQMMGNVGDRNRDAFEKVIMQLVMRLCELSDVDVSMAASDTIGETLLLDMVQRTAEQVMGQQQQIGQLQQQMAGMAQPTRQEPEGGMPMPQQAQMPPQEPVVPPEAAVPPEAEVPMEQGEEEPQEAPETRIPM